MEVNKFRKLFRIVTNLLLFKILAFIYFIYIHTYSMYEQ